jgi:hypothetical protein
MLTLLNVWTYKSIFSFDEKQIQLFNYSKNNGEHINYNFSTNHTYKIVYNRKLTKTIFKLSEHIYMM